MLGWLKRKPDYIVPRNEASAGPAINRWHLLPRNNWFNIYLHQTVWSNDPIALHDHPYWNLSIVLRKGWWEIMPESPLWPFDAAQWACDDALKFSLHRRKSIAARYCTNFRRVWRGAGSFILRRPTDAHRLELETTEGRWPATPPVPAPVPIPAWSLFITGPRVRPWGMWMPDGWVKRTTGKPMTGEP